MNPYIKYNDCSYSPNHCLVSILSINNGLEGSTILIKVSNQFYHFIMFLFYLIVLVVAQIENIEEAQAENIEEEQVNATQSQQHAEDELAIAQQMLLDSQEDIYGSMSAIINELKKQGVKSNDNPFIKILAPLLGVYDKGNPKQDKPNIMDTQTFAENIIKYQNSTFQKWSKNLIDFTPDDLLSFTLEKQEVLIEEIKAPTKIRGTYFVGAYQKKIKLVIKDKNNTLYKVENEEQIFEIEIKQPGEIKFIFSNKNPDPVQVTFAIDIHNSYNDYLAFSDLDPINQRIELMQINTRDIYVRSKLSQHHYNSGYETLNQAEDKLLIYSLVETISIIAITVWQVFYLKRILSNEKFI
ncbi:hypothetical protein pb186bvf_014223 [Paramecium bursaria]